MKLTKMIQSTNNYVDLILKNKEPNFMCVKVNRNPDIKDHKVEEKMILLDLYGLFVLESLLTYTVF